MNTSELVLPRHLNRRAMIYIRQSSPNQVLTNKESQRMQYALRERAVGLGWNEQDTHFVDADLGRSGATIEQREGFQQLVADIALGTVGILLAFDATRLARNCSHWYQLLDLCGLHDCLIADRDGVYDPSSINGRLLLGLKGQISELELHTIRARLTAGILSKAERGELGLTLPTGLIRTDGVVTKHPSIEVQDRIDLIFATFFEQKSVAQTVRWFIKNDLLLPRRDRHGDIQWKRVTAASISSFLNNPAYAGAATYGRSRWKKSDNTGRMQQKKLPPQQWRYCVKDKYPQYISWDTFERIQAMLRDNYTEYARNKTRGVPREGKALLHGIMYCGECGHKMCVQYKGGTQYLCNYLKQQTGAPVCQRIRGDAIDNTVVSWFFEALSVAEIDVAGGGAGKHRHRTRTSRHRTSTTGRTVTIRGAACRASIHEIRSGQPTGHWRIGTTMGSVPARTKVSGGGTPIDYNKTRRRTSFQMTCSMHSATLGHGCQKSGTQSCSTTHRRRCCYEA